MEKCAYCGKPTNESIRNTWVCKEHRHKPTQEYEAILRSRCAPPSSIGWDCTWEEWDEYIALGLDRR